MSHFRSNAEPAAWWVAFSVIVIVGVGMLGAWN